MAVRDDVTSDRNLSPCGADMLKRIKIFLLKLSIKGLHLHLNKHT